MPRLAVDTAVRYSKSHQSQNLLSGSLRKAEDPISPTAPLLHLRELSSGRDNLRVLFSRRIELFEIGDDIVNLLGVLQAWKSHFGTGYLGLRILDVFAESCFIPGDSGIFVRGGIAESLNRSSLSPEQPVSTGPTAFFAFSPNLVTRLHWTKSSRPKPHPGHSRGRLRRFRLRARERDCASDCLQGPIRICSRKPLTISPIGCLQSSGKVSSQNQI